MGITILNIVIILIAVLLLTTNINLYINNIKLDKYYKSEKKEEEKIINDLHRKDNVKKLIDYLREQDKKGIEHSECYVIYEISNIFDLDDYEFKEYKEESGKITAYFNGKEI